VYYETIDSSEKLEAYISKHMKAATEMAIGASMPFEIPEKYNYFESS